MANRFFFASLLALASLGFVESTALADGSGNKAAAEGLFDEGRSLFDAGKISDACPKFELSMKLDPAIGTALNLGRCYERVGKLASAWSTYRDASAMARREGDSKRAGAAEERANALKPKLSYLRLDIASPAKGTTIKRNGEALDLALMGNELPVDAGKVNVEVSAPAFKTFAGSVQVREGAHERMAIPALEADPSMSGAGAASDRTSTSEENGPSSGLGTQKILALVAGGVAVVGAGVSVVFAIDASSKLSDSKPFCPSSNECTRDGVDLRSKAGTSADMSTAFAIGAGVFAGGGRGLVAYGTFSRETHGLGAAVADGSFLVEASATTPNGHAVAGAGITRWRRCVRIQSYAARGREAFP